MFFKIGDRHGNCDGRRPRHSNKAKSVELRQFNLVCNNKIKRTSRLVLCTKRKTNNKRKNVISYILFGESRKTLPV